MFSWNLYLGSFLSLPVFADGLGWLRLILGCPPSIARWWRLLPLFLSGTCRLALLGLQCLWIPWSCGVPGLHDGVTCIRLGLCSSSVRDRDVCFPSFGGFDYWPSCGVPCLSMRWSGWLSLLLMGRSCSFALGSSSLDLVGVGGFHRVPSPLSSFGIWSPFGVNSALIANEGFHWRWFLLRCSLPFRGSVVVFLRPL